MNGCAHRRKEMALVASDPDASELSPALGRHIVHCPQCREYWDEIKALCALCNSAAKVPNASVPSDFHEAWLSQTREPRRPAPSRPFPSFGNWPLKIGVAVAAVLLLIVAIPFRDRSAPDLSDVVPIHTIPRDQPATVTLLDYHLAASDSELDSLLRQDTARSSDSRGIYTMLTRSEEETYY
jgi:hypothetical protein